MGGSEVRIQMVEAEIMWERFSKAVAVLKIGCFLL